MKGAVFLDRDGTLNIEVGYIRELDKLQLMPGVGETLRWLNERQIPAIVVTNQSGVARGYYDEPWLEQLHQRLRQLLQAEEAYVDAVYYCPHLPDGVVPAYTQICGCRKPEPGMLLQAQQDHDIDFKDSFMVGDKATDVEVGQRVNCKTILLRSGYGEQVLNGTYQHSVTPDHIATDLHQAFLEVIKPYYSGGLSHPF